MTLLVLLACRGPVVDTGVPDRDLPSDPADTGTTSIAPVEVPHVWINELMPENDSTWQSADGRLPAWAELRNGSDQVVVRADLALNGAPLTWVGEGDTLEPGELALVEVPDDDAKDTLELTWHGTPTDSVNGGDPGPDWAWARFGSDDAPSFSLTGQPTPGYDNGSAPQASPDELLFEDYARIDIQLPDSSAASLDVDPYGPVSATIGYERVWLPIAGFVDDEDDKKKWAKPMRVAPAKV